MSSGILSEMASIVSVIRDGYSTEFVVEREDPDGSLLLRPQGSLGEMHRRLDSQPLTSAEFDELIAPHIQPSDGEG